MVVDPCPFVSGDLSFLGVLSTRLFCYLLSVRFRCWSSFGSPGTLVPTAVLKISFVPPHFLGVCLSRFRHHKTKLLSKKCYEVLMVCQRSYIISGFRRGVNEPFIILGYYEALVEVLPTFRNSISIPSSGISV